MAKGNTPKKPVPFSFVLELLEDLDPRTNPMFGCTAVYVGEKIVLVLRDKPTESESNGIWIATTPEHHAALKVDFPSMCNISVLGPGQTGWQMIRATDPELETFAERLCEYIRRGDVRIGKIPKRKKAKPMRSAAKKR